MADLESLALDAETPNKLVLINPATSQPIRAFDGSEAHILLMGVDSKAAQKHRREATNRMLAKRNRNKMTAEEIEASNVDLWAALTRGWVLVNFAGETVDYEFSEANARRLYSNPNFAWIKDQVDEFVGDRANFMKRDLDPN